MKRYQRFSTIGIFLAVTMFSSRPVAAQIVRIAEMNTRQIQALNLLAWSVTNRKDLDFALFRESQSEARLGRLKSAREFTRRSVEAARQSELQEISAYWKASGAAWEASFGYPAEARRAATQALNASKGRDVQFAAALALAQAGQSDHADGIAEELSRRFPKDTVVNTYYLPDIRATAEISRGNAASAIELLQTTSPYELGDACLFSIYERGQAFLLTRNGAAAAGEFQKILLHRGIIRNCPYGALARLGLARAYALSGDPIKSRTAYQDFLTLWKNADPDIPVLLAAKSEYARLN
jgi:predicted Zn-dependent protease